MNSNEINTTEVNLIVKIIVWCIVTSLGVFLVILFFGNPQWNKFIYIFQKHIIKMNHIGYPPNSYTGEWCEWNENGQIMYLGNYIDGEKNGVAMYWDLNGQLRSKSFWKSGQESGRWTEWYANNQIKITGQYFELLREGEWVTYYNNGRIKSEISYKNDRAEGLIKMWHQNRKLKLSGECEDGIMIGEWLKFDINETITNTKLYGPYSAEFVDDRIFNPSDIEK